jgi:hypothetical protein
MGKSYNRRLIVKADDVLELAELMRARRIAYLGRCRGGVKVRVE